MIEKYDFILTSTQGRKFACDIHYIVNQSPKPVVIFVHGFKGFKDWGHFNQIAIAFAQRGYSFIKISLSQNGTTPEQPVDFADLEAFGHQTYAQDLADLGTLLDYIHSSAFPLDKEVDLQKIALLGHSRGGCVVLLKSAEERRIKAAVTWESVSRAGFIWNEQNVSKIKNEGVIYVQNMRTKQEMPLYKVIYDEVSQSDKYNLENAVKRLEIPVCIIHGKSDFPASHINADRLMNWAKHGELCLIPNADHTFGGKHPFTDIKLPADTKTAIDYSVHFLEEML